MPRHPPHEAANWLKYLALYPCALLSPGGQRAGRHPGVCCLSIQANRLQLSPTDVVPESHQQSIVAALYPGSPATTHWLKGARQTLRRLTSVGCHRERCCIDGRGSEPSRKPQNHRVAASKHCPFAKSASIITSEPRKMAVPTIDPAEVAGLQLGRTHAEPMIMVRWCWADDGGTELR